MKLFLMIGLVITAPFWIVAGIIRALISMLWNIAEDIVDGIY